MERDVVSSGEPTILPGHAADEPGELTPDASGWRFDAMPSPAAVEPTPALPTGFGAILGATIDVYVATFGHVIAVTVPYAILSVILTVALAASNTAIIDGLALALAVALVIRIAGVHVRGGREPAAETLSAALRRFLPLFAWSFLIGLAVAGLGVLAAIPMIAVGAWAGGASAGLPATIAALLIVGGIATIGGLVLLARWSLGPPAIVLDGEGPLSGARMSVALVRGRTRSVAVLVLVGATTVAIGSAAAFAPYAIPELGEGLGLVVAGAVLAVVLPVLPILFTVLYTRLDGTAVVLARVSAGRSAVVVGLVGAALAAGVAIVAMGGIRFIEETAPLIAAQGTVAFGTAGEGCTVEGAVTRFAVGDEVHLAAVLRRELAAGDTIVVRIFIDGELADEATNTFADAAQCVYGAVPTDGMPAGRYRLEYSEGSEVLASGEFDLVAP
jgi:hypothetical protein